MPRGISGGFTPTVSYTEPTPTATGRGRYYLLRRGSDSTGQLVVTGGLGTNESPYKGYVFGWLGGTGAAYGASNFIRIRVPRGPKNWLRIKRIHMMVGNGAGCDYTPAFGISDGGGNTDMLPLGGTKIVTTGVQDALVWECDTTVRIDQGIDDAVADSMSNLVPETGTNSIPSISIWTAGYASVATMASNFMVQIEWVEL